jgi:hypothetical protein
VKVKKQIQKVQRFHDDLEIHYYLWANHFSSRCQIIRSGISKNCRNRRIT